MLDIAFESFEHNRNVSLDYATFEMSMKTVQIQSLDVKVSKLLMHCVNINTQQLQHIINMYNKKKIEANLRGYDSVIDYLLQEQEVTREMYDRQIDVIMSDLAPVMQKYAKILQRIHNLDKMRFEDLKYQSILVMNQIFQ